MHNNVASIQKNRGDKSHRVIVALIYGSNWSKRLSNFAAVVETLLDYGPQTSNDARFSQTVQGQSPTAKISAMDLNPENTHFHKWLTTLLPETINQTCKKYGLENT